MKYYYHFMNYGSYYTREEALADILINVMKANKEKRDNQ